MQRFVLWLLLGPLAGFAGAAETAAVYTHLDSWPESMAATRRAMLEGGLAPDMPSGEGNAPVLADWLARRFWHDFAETDWFLQDAAQRGPGEPLEPVRDFGPFFRARDDAALEQALIARALDELSPPQAELASRLGALVQANAPAGDAAWLALYVDACRARRAQRLERLAAEAPAFVFTKHATLGGSHYAYTEGQSDAQAERQFFPGSSLCLARWDGEGYRVETLIDDPNGLIRDPDVSYDGLRVVFAWKKADREDDYHLYELDVASRAVRQITAGLGVADYEPAWLPDGGILFNSTRCVQIVDCWWTEVSNLYRCAPDGRQLRRLTFDQVHDNYPTVTDDGRILYTRWEYNDRGQIYTQPLLQMNADGTCQSEFYGGNSWFPTTILHARGVPGTQKALAIATGHHSRQTGKLIRIDPARGRQENTGVQLVAPVRDTPAVKVDAYGQEGELFQYPYPLSESECLVTYHPAGWAWNGQGGPRFAVYWMAMDGRRELLAGDARLPCSQSVPLRPRAASLRPSLVDDRQAEGVCYVQDVYAGPGLADVARRTVRRLRVVALDFRAAGIGSNGNGGPGGGAMISTPVAIGNGTWDPKIVLGEATVQADGSAMFRIPARTPVFFQLLDDRGRLVQTMRSWTTLQPGETASCVGCHEHKNTAPRAELPVTVALGQPAQQLLGAPETPQGFSYARAIQPILDRHCTRCHDGRADAQPDLTARTVHDPEAKRHWFQSYLSLTHAKPERETGRWRGDPDHPVLNWVSAQSAPPLQSPFSAGSNRSSLMALLDAGHAGAKLAPAELETVACWIDLGVPFCGDYVEANAWTPEERARYDHYLSKRQRLAEQVNAWLPEERPHP